MIVALKPEREVDDAEHLKSLAEVRRAIAWNALEHLRDVLTSDLYRLLAVAVGKRDYIVNRALSVDVGGLAESQKSLLNRLRVVGREVRYVSELVDEVL